MNMNTRLNVLGSVMGFLIITSCSVHKKTVETKETVKVVHDTLYAKQNVESMVESDAKKYILNDSTFANAHIGISVYDASNNSYLYNYQAEKYFIPASNMKLFTCYAAMKYLGDSLVGLRYEIKEDTLFIQGAGDPTLLQNDFKTNRVIDWIDKNKNKAIVINDLNWREKGLGFGWAWDDYNDDYMAERSPMPIYGNLVTFRYNKEGELNAIPSGLDFTFENVRAAGNTYSIRRNEHENIFRFEKMGEQNQPLAIPLITKGAQLTQKMLQVRLGKNKPVLLRSKMALTSADLYNQTMGKNENPFKSYSSVIHSQPTDSLLKIMMYRSDNFFAEQSLLMVSNERLGVMSDAKIIDTLLKTDFKNMPQKPKWVDGSGLSRYNLISPQDFVLVLNKMKNEFSWNRIATILPTGNTGTLNGYYKNYAGRIYAKTGTLSNNISLSGYIITAKNKTFIFSILVNNHQSPTSNIRRSVERFLTSVMEKY
jgi:D-alanyl-D-alanine carboxypeptidase/D-alanyl-D-alanine-endopeptidase (penicillin-binding protein 4)